MQPSAKKEKKKKNKKKREALRAASGSPLISGNEDFFACPEGPRQLLGAAHPLWSSDRLRTAPVVEMGAKVQITFGDKEREGPPGVRVQGLGASGGGHEGSLASLPLFKSLITPYQPL